MIDARIRGGLTRIVFEVEEGAIVLVTPVTACSAED